MNIEEKLVKKLKELNYKISFGESITGGLLASTIINVSGSSNVIEESYVTYSNNVKNKILGVKFETIDKFDVVSREVVLEMVYGLFNKTKSDVCATVSGYAETEIKNYGYAWYAIKIKNRIFSEKIEANGNRNEVRNIVKDEILNKIYEMLGE